MPQNRNEKPTVATHADHEVITPPDHLRKAVAIAKPAGFDPVARAEAALAEFEGEFSNWMNQECEQLNDARRRVVEDGFSKDTRDALFRAAHDIKGEAATFGFPLVEAPADSLCRLIEHTPDMSRIPLPLVEQHVDAIRAITRESARPDADDVAATLTRRLRDVTNEFLLHENRDRPEVLNIIMAPPLVPGGR